MNKFKSGQVVQVMNEGRYRATLWVVEKYSGRDVQVYRTIITGGVDINFFLEGDLELIGEAMRRLMERHQILSIE